MRVATAMNVAEVYTKYQIGRYIVEEEQSGNKRAEYGKLVLEGLSDRLTARYGDGWSVESLTLCRKFFSVYSNFVNTVYEIEKKGSPNLTDTVYQIGATALPHSEVLPEFTLF